MTAPATFRTDRSAQPKPGDYVRATVMRPKSYLSIETICLEDGSMVLSPEEISRFGGGNLEWGRKEIRRMMEVERDVKVHQGPAMRPKSVRVATAADEQAVFDLIMLDLKENAEIVAPINPAKVRRNIHQAITGEGGPKGIIGIIGPEKSPDRKSTR